MLYENGEIYRSFKNILFSLTNKHKLPASQWSMGKLILLQFQTKLLIRQQEFTGLSCNGKSTKGNERGTMD